MPVAVNRSITFPSRGPLFVTLFPFPSCRAAENAPGDSTLDGRRARHRSPVSGDAILEPQSVADRRHCRSAHARALAAIRRRQTMDETQRVTGASAPKRLAGSPFRPIPPGSMTLRRGTSLRCVLRRGLLAGRAAGGKAEGVTGRDPCAVESLFKRLRNIGESDRQRAGGFGGRLVSELADRAMLIGCVLLVTEDLGGGGTGHRHHQDNDPGAPVQATRCDLRVCASSPDHRFSR